MYNVQTDIEKDQFIQLNHALNMFILLLMEQKEISIKVYFHIVRFTGRLVAESIFSFYLYIYYKILGMDGSFCHNKNNFWHTI